MGESRVINSFRFAKWAELVPICEVAELVPIEDTIKQEKSLFFGNERLLHGDKAKTSTLVQTLLQISVVNDKFF